MEIANRFGYRALIPLVGAMLCLQACQKPVPEATLTPATPVASTTPARLELPPEIDPALEKGQLRAYYRKKYTQREFDSVRELVEEVLPHYSPSEKRQAIAEILSFFYVIFHETEHHRLDRNHAALRKHEKSLLYFCEKYKVPYQPVMAIVSWENSGGSNKVSFADAAGLGQMTDGAIETAHTFAQNEAARLRQEAEDPSAIEPLAKHLESIEKRHRVMAKQAGERDERFVPECNLEDVVLFFKFLLRQYADRVDHAIGTYHKGVGNTDDLLYDYLVRLEGQLVYPAGDRNDFLSALERRNVHYITLWNDPRSRQMLNGLRTMDGEVTTEHNRSQALGDESDIYPWKVLGSLAAYRQGDAYVQEQIQRYSEPQSEVEVKGLPLYQSLESMKAAVKQHHLVHSRAPLSDLGFRADQAAEYAEMGDLVTPELEGYLFSLVARWRKAANQADLELPVKTLMNTRAVAHGQYGLFSKVQLRGVTALIAPQELSGYARKNLKKVLEVDFLNDRIYRSTLENGDILICLNPRFGHQFWAAYEKYRGTKSANP